MADSEQTVSIRLRVKWSEQTVACFEAQGVDIAWNESDELDVRCPKPPQTVEDIATWIEGRVEGLYSKQTGGRGEVQVQVRSMRAKGSSDALPWKDDASQHLKDGDTVVVDCAAITDSTAAQRRPSFSEEELNQVRDMLRFGLNDRVLCFCGSRWLCGIVVGTAVPEEDSLLPYVVKTDPLPGFPSRTISVPYDRDQVCTQEICFHPESQLHLVKAAATLLAGSTRPKLRFAAGDKVVCRMSNCPEDYLERWFDGVVDAIWPELPGERKWTLGDASGEFPPVVPYKVSLAAGGWVYCHRDHHTLIRREGLQPQERVWGISKRMEVRKAPDGSLEKFDHQTGRGKRIAPEDDDASAESA